MNKIMVLLLSVSLAGCSCFSGTKEMVTVTTNVPNSEIFANGEKVGEGKADFFAKRNKNVQLMVRAEGYSPEYRYIYNSFSTAGILDIIGTFIFILPFVGLLTPGAHTLNENNIALELMPLSYQQNTHRAQAAYSN